MFKLIVLFFSLCPRYSFSLNTTEKSLDSVSSLFHRRCLRTALAWAETSGVHHQCLTSTGFRVADHNPFISAAEPLFNPPVYSSSPYLISLCISHYNLRNEPNPTFNILSPLPLFAFLCPLLFIFSLYIWNSSYHALAQHICRWLFSSSTTQVCQDQNKSMVMW